MDPELQNIHNATVNSLRGGLAEKRRAIEVLGLQGAAESYLLAQLLKDSDRLCVIVCADLEQARLLTTELRYFHPRAADIALLPHWEMNPYEPLSPHPELEAMRMACLSALSRNRLKALVLPLRSLMQRVIPRPVLERVTVTLEVEEEYPRKQLLEALTQLGYQPVPLVEERGTFAVRGDIVDLFPADREQPVRLDFYGDFVERIRSFNPLSQRSDNNDLQQLTLIPARELIPYGPFLENFSRHFKDRCDELGVPRTERDAIIAELREGILAPGRQFLLPFNYGQLDPLQQYLDNPRYILIDPPAIEQEIDLFQRSIRDGEAHMLAKNQPHARREALYLPAEDLTFLSREPERLEISRLQIVQLDEDRRRYHFNCHGHGQLKIRPGGEGDGLEALLAEIEQSRQNKRRCLIVCRQTTQAERLQELLGAHGLSLPLLPDSALDSLQPGRPALGLGSLDRGFSLPDENLTIVTEEDIFGRRSRRRKKSGRPKNRQWLSSLVDLQTGDFIVHADHGIGRYLGLQFLQLGNISGDFLHLEYADNDKLYLPIERIEKVQKYIGGEGHTPKLDKMGGQGWEKARLKARAAVEELARQLLEIYAKRELRQGFSFSAPDQMFREFEATFPHEETEDQYQAIVDTLNDMQSAKPMDRLICGDVGYGKTEVALRAAVKAVLDDKQVAVLVPTTVLARQHWESFHQRLTDFPIRVGMVSRFRTPAENRATLEATATGRVDILIGTHRLLQRDVRFKNLGLLIVDEEQRFGVSHKEKLKQLRAEVDILTLTATPIPRTLHMSLTGIRDLSVIETAPVDRLAIRTYVTRFEDELIRQAILRELGRGGQVYFVHNRVRTIGAMAEQLRRLVPEAKLAIGHGQMPEKQLEQVMLDFIDGKSNLLVASTIIENGLDIPRANTIIINRADCFGLSQLYQLRGRVGRSDRRAYAYLLIPGEAALTRDARERLRILQELTELGAGFRIASHDLELRGAGDLLGGKQSGTIAAIGFELYTELLEETIARLRGHEREDRIDPEIRLGISAYLPDGYLPDPNQRLQFYQRMAAAEEDEQLFDLVEELRGPLR